MTHIILIFITIAIFSIFLLLVDIEAEIRQQTTLLKGIFALLDRSEDEKSEKEN